MKIDHHEKFAEKIGDYLNDLSRELDTDEVIDFLKAAYDNLAMTKSDIISFEDAYRFIAGLLRKDEIKIIVMNSQALFADSQQYSEGINIIVGGNTLGRGITFPKLQTVYYFRQARNPQVDTVWQHARMFGYDRDSGLMRLLMPPVLAKLFTNLNK